LRGATSNETSSFSQEDLLAICCVLCTADYCLDTTGQLESKLREKIDHGLSDKVEFASEVEAFHR